MSKNVKLALATGVVFAFATLILINWKAKISDTKLTRR